MTDSPSGKVTLTVACMRGRNNVSATNSEHVYFYRNLKYLKYIDLYVLSKLPSPRHTICSSTFNISIYVKWLDEADDDIIKFQVTNFRVHKNKHVFFCFFFVSYRSINCGAVNRKQFKKIFSECWMVETYICRWKAKCDLNVLSRKEEQKIANAQSVIQIGKFEVPLSLEMVVA